MRTTVTVQMVTGVMVILWLSERNAKYGIGGRTMLIVVNLLDGILSTISGRSLRNLMIPLTISAAVMFVVLVMENAEKRIPVQRISIHNIYADKNYMAVKLNPVGVMPVMFSTALFMLPQLLVSLLVSLFPNHTGILWWQENLSLMKVPGIAVYIICLCLLTVVFSMVLISPKDITEQFLKSGDSLVNIHAGRDTRRYLRGVMWRISLFSSAVMSACVGIPLMMQTRGNIDSGLMMLPSSIMMLTWSSGAVFTGNWRLSAIMILIVRSFRKRSIKSKCCILFQPGINRMNGVKTNKAGWCDACIQSLTTR